MKPGNFFTDLRRRNEIRAGALYTAGAWLGLARVEAQVGEVQSAMDHLDQLLSSSGGETLSVATIQIDPVWDPIRNDPRFKTLLAKHAVGEKSAAR